MSQRIHVCDNRTDFCLYNNRCIAFNAISTEQLRRLDSSRVEKGQVAFDFSRCERERKGHNHCFVPIQNRVKRELDIMSYFGIAELGYRTLNDNIVAQIPSAQGVECDNLNERA